MPGIYQNAYLTIAAAATENSHGGIFVERAWVKKSKTFMTPVRRQRHTGSIMVDFPLDHGLQGEKTNYLNSRAWCFQEARLSPRLLTFDRLQMTFTCLRHGLVESREVPEAVAREDRNSFLSNLISTSKKDDESKRRDLVVNWYQLLTDYTIHSLTFLRDKLVAIAGIARFLGDLTQDSYSAGLWHHNLPQSLLWSPYEEETFPNVLHKAFRPQSYRAPSWSWAAVESPISNFL